MRHLRRTVLTAIVALCVLAATDETLAGGRRRFLWRHVPSAGPPLRGYYDTYHQDRRFPKYYGGFHARYFQDIGVPPGDVGLRGNGIYPTPW